MTEQEHYDRQWFVLTSLLTIAGMFLFPGLLVSCLLIAGCYLANR